MTHPHALGDSVPADINADCVVDIYDVVLVCSIYGITSGHYLWDPLCDLETPYGIIDFNDVTAVSSSYGDIVCNKVGEFLTVANINWSNASQIVVDIINAGTADAKIMKVYLGTSPTSLTEQTAVTYNPATQIASKDAGWIRISIATTWASGTRYYFRFLTEIGDSWDHDERAP